ncbi:MAG: FAD-dependent oxidoreductase [Candidatus Eremiobacteraeota bacterium]|nr:FAD-dependent oxidoreductase [Candidatus Eremiobacteraeota bacterium]
MSSKDYDLTIIGAGAGGLIAADFAARLGAKVAIVERDRIGGDCTWTGCVPSKALLKVAKVAHMANLASRYGIIVQRPVTDMKVVRAYVDGAVNQIYQATTPKALERKGIDVYQGHARFLSSREVSVDERRLPSRKFLITTGAHPIIPTIEGLGSVPYSTYKSIFNLERLPKSLIVIGAGPVGTELTQAFQRIGAQVTVIAERILSKEESSVQGVIQRVFEREGVRFVFGRARSIRREGTDIIVTTGKEQARGDLVLVAIGREPTLDDLDLEKAGVDYTHRGIKVDGRLRTSVKNIFAAGDVAAGAYQYSHFAGWQAFHAVRNALLPGSSRGFTDIVPRVTFTDPEVAHVGLEEQQARSAFGDRTTIQNWTLDRVDRAVCEDDRDGFLKITAKRNGTILGATLVSQSAGEAITEFALAIRHKLKVMDLANTIHAYPTYSSGVQLMLTEMTLETLLSGTSGRIVRGLSALVR